VKQWVVDVLVKVIDINQLFFFELLQTRKRVFGARLFVGLACPANVTKSLHEWGGREGG
jgi:hypothetical protein